MLYANIVKLDNPLCKILLFSLILSQVLHSEHPIRKVTKLTIPIFQLSLTGAPYITERINDRMRHQSNSHKLPHTCRSLPMSLDVLIIIGKSPTVHPNVKGKGLFG